MQNGKYYYVLLFFISFCKILYLLTDSPNVLLNLFFRRFSLQKIETGLKIEAAAEIS
jgi:hypothetical protein